MSTNSPQESESPKAPPTFAQLSADAIEYWTDAWQRSILFWDVLRERGNQYIEHEESGKPPVLVFDYQIVLDARRFERAANYALAAIEPPKDCPPTDNKQRPFVVIDPRAGHGPGIGGFKMDSEIGIALRAGHPCYFVMFFPQPVANQTIECVTLAERLFLEKVNERHPDAPKPFVIGNCQGGWALMILASLAPDKVGPILLAGSPISYWAGVTGKNPMRYLGGLMGGTWTASLAGDLGNGRFDGANLVNNFEELDPANTYWKKPYGLYSKIDTERERYLEFERWWGGHFLLNKAEMEWITQNLFVGNRLSAGDIVINGEPVNLHNIRSPIVVFASWGDNITPPQQALNWIPDLYDSVEEIRDNEQTIVYFLHEQVGHLGIFVSSGIANREHSEFASALDLIDVLPPGLYQAIIRDSTPDMPGLQGGDDRHIIRFEPREITDILALGDDRECERPFELVRHISQINQASYDHFVSPFIKAFTSELSAMAMRKLNPARFERLLVSDSNPFLKALKPWADIVRGNRLQVSPDNPFLHMEKKADDAIGTAWNQYRDKRDNMYEKTFKALYESPVLAAATGFKPEVARKLRKLSHDAEHAEIVAHRRTKHEALFDHGNAETGFMRLLIYVASGSGVIDDRPFHGMQRMMKEMGLDKTISMQQLKETVRQQTFLVRMDEERALTSLNKLLTTKAERQRAIELTRQLLALGGPISEEKEARLHHVAQVLGLEQAAGSGKREPTASASSEGLAVEETVHAGGAAK
jgi:pimeloyl-ACP methyl ester carboxylesterase